MPGQPRDRRRLEEIPVVLPGPEKPRRALAQRKSEVEFRRLPGESHRLQGQPRQLHAAAAGVLEDEHHLEERRAAGVALGRQLLDHPLEGDVLVLVGGERRPLCRRH